MRAFWWRENISIYLQWRSFPKISFSCLWRSTWRWSATKAVWESLRSFSRVLILSVMLESSTLWRFLSCILTPLSLAQTYFICLLINGVLQASWTIFTKAFTEILGKEFIHSKLPRAWLILEQIRSLLSSLFVYKNSLPNSLRGLCLFFCLWIYLLCVSSWKSHVNTWELARIVASWFSDASSMLLVLLYRDITRLCTRSGLAVEGVNTIL